MRQFILDRDLDEFGKVTLSGRDYRYLAQVLRIQPGTQIPVRMNNGVLADFVVESVAKSTIVLKKTDSTALKTVCNESSSGVAGGVRAQTLEKNIPFCRIWLLQCMPKASKLDTIIRQAVETGVERIFPVVSDRSVYEKAKTVEKKDRWSRIVKEARQQSASPQETFLESPAEMAIVLERLNVLLNNEKMTQNDFSSVSLVLTESRLENRSLHGSLREKPDLIILAVGSEGGISPSEMQALRNSGFLPIHFETNVLRTETAAIYGISAVQTIMTEYETWQFRE